jgi:hypothetical protein
MASNTPGPARPTRSQPLGVTLPTKLKTTLKAYT